MAPPKLGELSEAETLLFDKISDDKWDEVKGLIGQKDVRVDCLDKTGMTPLMHACYKGKAGMSEFLIANGANVNSNYHEHGYTSLMFAALSGKTDVTQVILEKGGSTTMTNAVNRNASQMAAFVGQHQCVTLINNFFSQEDLDYYTQPHDLETEPKLKAHLAPALYKIIICSNLNPVRASILLRDHPELLENSKQIVRLLDILCEKMMKQRGTNEVMGIKFHYLSCVVRECAKSWDDNSNKLDHWFKILLRERLSDMWMLKQEELVRSTFKSFPYVECALLQQLIRSIAPTKIGEGTSALSILNSGVNGNRMGSDDDNPCTTCGEFYAKKCAACKSVNYCNRDCQKLHWFTHKNFCKKLAEQHKVYMAQKKIMDEEEAKRKAEEEKRKAEAEAEAQADAIKDSGEIIEDKPAEDVGDGDTLSDKKDESTTVQEEADPTKGEE